MMENLTLQGGIRSIITGSERREIVEALDKIANKAEAALFYREGLSDKELLKRLEQIRTITDKWSK